MRLRLLLRDHFAAQRLEGHGVGVERAADRLKPGGLLMVEIAASTAGAVADIAKSNLMFEGVRIEREGTAWRFNRYAERAQKNGMKTGSGAL